MRRRKIWRTKTNARIGTNTRKENVTVKKAKVEGFRLEGEEETHSLSLRERPEISLQRQKWMDLRQAPGINNSCTMLHLHDFCLAPRPRTWLTKRGIPRAQSGSRGSAPSPRCCRTPSANHISAKTTVDDTRQGIKSPDLYGNTSPTFLSKQSKRGGEQV